MWSSNPYPRELPKTQTTSLLAARFQRFSPRWSAFWAPHYLEPRPRRRQSGGIAPCKGATRRRHAVRRLCMAQNPHRHQWRARCRGREGLAAAPAGGGGAWPGFETTRRSTRQHAKRRRCGGRRRVRRARAGFEAGPGCGARGRWRGLAGLRDDAPSEARGADGERAGRRPRAHKAARPSRAHKAARPSRAHQAARPSKRS